jgi:hypothetical protein
MNFHMVPEIILIPLIIYSLNKSASRLTMFSDISPKDIKGNSSTGFEYSYSRFDEN